MVGISSVEAWNLCCERYVGGCEITFESRENTFEWVIDMLIIDWIKKNFSKKKISKNDDFYWKIRGYKIRNMPGKINYEIY